MRNLLFSLFLFVANYASAQEIDAYDLGITPNGYLTEKHSIDYCVKHNQYNIRHLYISTERDFNLFLQNADKLRHIDSLSIGRMGNFCKIIYEIENRVLEQIPDLPDLPNLKFLSIVISSAIQMPSNLL